MGEVETNVRISWQLVSQFVSWDFCRYMCEEDDNQATEPDVLTFLRNMIVERTEKAASDITKHEIIAKFIMEVKTIRSISRMSTITAISETVVKICPELKKAVSKLLLELEGLLSDLEWNAGTEKHELIVLQMSHAVNDFTVEACKVLPLPELLQVIQSWMHPDLQSQIWKARHRTVENTDLYRKVVHCLQEEIITPTEAKVIAFSLYDDKVLEQFIVNAETETEADSQQNSQSIYSSQIQPSCSERSLQLLSQFKLTNPVPLIEPEERIKSFGFKSSGRDHSHRAKSQSPSPRLSQTPNESVKRYELKDCVQELGPLDPNRTYSFKPSHPEVISHRKSPPQLPHTDSEPEHSEIEDFSPVKPMAKNKSRERFRKYFRLDEDFSDDDPLPVLNSKMAPNCSNVPDDVPFTNPFSKGNSGSDTSDCDKDPQIRFLTPTMYKEEDAAQAKPKSPKVVWLSDSESSFTTNPVNSQKDESFRCYIQKPRKSSPLRTLKQRVKKNLSRKKEDKKKMKPSNQRQPSPPPQQNTLRKFGFTSGGASDRSATSSATSPSKILAPKRYKLFDNDIVLRSADESALFQKNTARKKTDVKLKELGNRRRCQECRKTFPTPSALKKHVFIEHTVEDFSQE